LATIVGLVVSTCSVWLAEAAEPAIARSAINLKPVPASLSEPPPAHLLVTRQVFRYYEF